MTIKEQLELQKKFDNREFKKPVKKPVKRAPKKVIKKDD